MNIQENISLKAFNTFGIDKNARFFITIKSIEELKQALTWAKSQNIKPLILGGGSNILLTQNQDTLVIKIELVGVEMIQETENFYFIKAGAGVNWHQFVLTAIENCWAGVENLSLIPGTVGASPMQNIGAYGVEIKDVFSNLTALNIDSLDLENFDAEQCQFGYRESVFKHDLKGKYVICSVVFRLSKKPEFRIDYGAIQDTLKTSGIKNLSLKAISDAVISIRQSKLPDPKEIGNAGSFFKNPTISADQYQLLNSEYSTIPGYPTSDSVKVPAAWLIEQCGWKGQRFGEIGVHANQPLVLVNYGDGDGNEIKKLAARIQQSVFDKFKITIHPEVNFL
ncbi:UDP-N-acetylmuramate dehydrogenase [Algoriphagus ratkowskyi]|uniref:UDP-N-acetylenolpyruvoylglucosamine reductase n=1 Tax=Algoriphagus ratkowskyi TaxID=57028 RepID=A0A2W7R8F0_9BACT|nr:UDP-N-acetylmuramate dehydrogenase [Algoriphagus ratkowskyi]PZX55386.1 UDP-N-acetylmuramate dehydrogenase [Algoriphagus ratkowskyi]TXD79686.1 UDP-N-acetylmuramate dehydrogenase [Algoriphagus ratkowskyi]